MEGHFIIEEGVLEFMINDKVMTVNAGTYVMVHAGIHIPEHTRSEIRRRSQRLREA